MPSMSEIEVYSNLPREEALSPDGITNPALLAIHKSMTKQLVVMPFVHWGYPLPANNPSQLKQGQLVVHESMETAFMTIAEELKEIRYPIQSAQPMSVFGWRDGTAMAHNNTSVYRPDFIGDHAKQVASEHTRGSAIDLNPLDNPLKNFDGTIEPIEVIGRILFAPAVIRGNDAVIDIFHRHDMEWGGYWPWGATRDFYGPEVVEDNHHFELRPKHLGRLAVPASIWPQAS